MRAGRITKKMNHAILIDPETKTISKLNDFKDDLSYHYQTIGNGCRTIDIVTLCELPDNRTIDLIIDDEGRFNNSLEGAFHIGELGIVNRAIVCIGNNKTGALEPIPDAIADTVFHLLSGNISFGLAADLEEPKVEVISW